MAAIKNKKTHKLTNIELIEDNGQYYLSVEYLIEDENRIEKLTIPRIEIPFNSKFMPDITRDFDAIPFNTCGVVLPVSRCFIQTGYRSKLEIEKVDGIYFKVETIKEKEHEMTIEEIEKKLGYKVKIVSGGKKK